VAADVLALAAHRESPYLKAHLKNGEVCVLDAWRTAPDGARCPAVNVSGRTCRSLSYRNPAAIGHSDAHRARGDSR